MVEHLDGHTEIIHMQLNNEWLPWSDLSSLFAPLKLCPIILWSLFCRLMKRRDLLLRRYWRREDDGTYGINVSSLFTNWQPL